LTTESFGLENNECGRLVYSLPGLDQDVHKVKVDPESGVTIFSNPTNKANQVGSHTFTVKACLSSVDICVSSPPLTMETMNSCLNNAIKPFSVADVVAVIGVPFNHEVEGYPFEDEVTSNSWYSSDCGGYSVTIKDRANKGKPDWVTWDYTEGRLAIDP
jgi:hypothetical protein